MKILLVFRGNLGAVVADHPGQTIPEAVSTRGTSHASEVNSLLVAHWLQHDHGHEVHWFGRSKPGTRDWLLQPTGPDVDVSDYDLVLLWKIRGVSVARDFGILDSVQGQKLATWFDAGGLASLMTPEQAAKVTHICWGTHGIAEHEARRWEAHQAVVEHACNFIADPDPLPLYEQGLYLGRLPPQYLGAVHLAANYAPMHVYGLWAPDGEGGKISLRPKASNAEALMRARKHVERSNVALFPAVNLATNHEHMSRYLFGFCPSTRARPAQVLSASKFYDYAGLGVPVVLSSNTPEARHMAGDTWLGELYDPGDPDSLRDAIERVRDHAENPESFYAERCRIRDWTRAHHTYRHRAQEIHNALIR
jgi:hypothetical protein